MRAALATLAALSALAAGQFQAAARAAVRGGEVLARVNGEAITAEDFLRELGSIHEGGSPEEAPRGRPDTQALLDRLITARLVAQEARNIGLDELPEFRREMDSFRLETLERLLLERQVRGVREADAGSVERRRRTIVGEARLASVRVRDEATARQAGDRIRSGAPFDAVASELLAAGEATVSGPDGRVRLSELPPEVAEVVAGLEPGQTSPPIAVEGGFLLVHLLELHAPEDEASRDRATQEALAAQRLEAIGRYTDDLERRYAKVNRELFDALDFEGKEPGLEALERDERVLVEIEGGSPITVADLARSLSRRFFHGAARAAEQGRLNRAKAAALHDLIVRRTTVAEALRLGLDRSDAFKTAVADHERAVLFGTFVRKVIAPEARLDEEDVRRFFAEHAADYAVAERVRLDAVAFAGREEAEQALAKLQAGADFEWTRQNAPGRLDGTAGEPSPELRGALVGIADLPEEIRKSLVGARAGDFRIYSAPAGPHYVLRVREMVPRSVPAFEDVREEVARRATGERMKVLLDEWTRKLRAASKIELRATAARLRRLAEGGRGSSR